MAPASASPPPCLATPTRSRSRARRSQQWVIVWMCIASLIRLWEILGRPKSFDEVWTARAAQSPSTIAGQWYGRPGYEIYAIAEILLTVRVGAGRPAVPAAALHHMCTRRLPVFTPPPTGVDPVLGELQSISVNPHGPIG